MIDCKELKEYRDLKKKYKEGLRKILQSLSKNMVGDVRLRYVRVVEIKMKLVWMGLEKEREEDRKNEEVIELDKEE